MAGDNTYDAPHAAIERPAEERTRTPILISPPITKTPPTENALRNGDTKRQDRSSEPVEPQALSKALYDLEHGPRQREHTPGASPSRKRQRVYGDR